MIIKFKIFEELIIGYRGDEYVKGVFIREYDIFKDSIEGIIRFLKKKKVEYCIFAGSDSKGYFFIILFPKLRYYKEESDIKVAIKLYKKEARKFPKDKYDKDKLILLSIDENGDEEKYSFGISSFQLDHIEDMTEIKIENDDDISKLDYTLDVISKSKNYNL